MPLEDESKPNSTSQQTNRENAKGWQTETRDNSTTYIGETVNIYGDRPRKPGAPFQMPPLPAHYIERPEHENPLKAKLLREDAVARGTLVVSAIHGLGGIGKSVLATKLAHDEEVQKRFSDGVLWVTLGQKPDLLPQLTGWIRALGDYDYPPTTLDAASTHLRTLLYDKAVLLVVDDVWNPEHVKPFQVGRDRCRMLITTRRADVADEADAELYQLELMTPEQSLELLSARLGRTLDGAEREEALRLAKAVGYLPIALDLVAARISRGIAWNELYQALEGEVARLEALEGPQHRRKGETRLEASFNLSLRALQEDVPEIWENFVWLGVLPEDAMVAAPLVTTLWDVLLGEAAERLELLWNDALLLPGPAIVVKEQTYRSYRVHDLLHDIACRSLTVEQPTGLGLTLSGAHRIILERYRAKTQQGQWHTLPNDGYIHAHLTWHLEKAEQLKLLHELLQEITSEGRNGWYEACDRLGQTANFVMDVARAWKLAEHQFDQNPAQSIALQLRYALITTTLNSLAKNIPVELMAVLVERGIWTPVQGLAHVQQIRDSKQLGLAIRVLAPFLPSNLLPEAFAITCSIQSELSLVDALRGLVQFLPEELLYEALEITRSIHNESSRAATLHVFAQYLPIELLPTALDVAHSIQDESSRAAALRGLVHYFNNVIYEALEVTCSIQDECYKADALNGLAQYLPKEALPEVTGAALSIQDETHRLAALIGLAQHHPEVIPETLELIFSIQNESDKIVALCKLVKYQPEVIPIAVRIALSIQNETHRLSLLLRLTEYQPQLIPETLELARLT